MYPYILDYYRLTTIEIVKYQIATKITCTIESLQYFLFYNILLTMLVQHITRHADIIGILLVN